MKRVKGIKIVVRYTDGRNARRTRTFTLSGEARGLTATVHYVVEQDFAQDLPFKLGEEIVVPLPVVDIGRGEEPLPVVNGDDKDKEVEQRSDGGSSASSAGSSAS